MKSHVQFLSSDGSDILGTDGILPLDGRLCYSSAIDNAHVQAWRLRHVRPDIAGYQVYRGSIASRAPVNGPSRFASSGPDGSRPWHGC